MVAFLVAIALLLALAARVAAAPALDDAIDDTGELTEIDADDATILEQPDVIDEPTADDSVAQLESIGVVGIAGAEDWLEDQARHQRPSPWGRVDLQLSLLHRDDTPGISAPHQFDELWVELIWRR